MTPTVYASTTPARAALDEARERAAREGKRVAAVFGADWCPDCHALDALLAHPLVARPTGRRPPAAFP